MMIYLHEPYNCTKIRKWNMEHGTWIWKRKRVIQHVATERKKNAKLKEDRKRIELRKEDNLHHPGHRPS